MPSYEGFFIGQTYLIPVIFGEYVRDDLVQLARFTNMELLELKGIDDFLTLVLPPGVVRSGYLLVTSLFRDWKDTWQMVGRKGSHWQSGKTRSSEL